MIERYLLCEGPEDIAAIRAIAMHLFGWPHGSFPSPELRALGVGESRAIDCKQLPDLLIRIGAARDAKSGLPTALADTIENSDGRYQHIGALFDPDVEEESTFHNALIAAITSGAPGWRVADESSTTNAKRWSVSRRDDESMIVHAIPWRSRGPIVDSMADAQHLERLECQILAAKCEELAKRIDKWIVEMRVIEGTKINWKSAVHLWCALLEPDQSTATFAEKVLYQRADLREHVKEAFAQTTLVEDLGEFLKRV